MSTLLQKNKISFYDRSFRLVRLFKKFTSLQYDPLPFTSLRHDGLLYKLDLYKDSITSYLGGPSLILKHTLFKATFSKNFSKLFWDDSYLSLKTNTFAQKRGLNQIPNKRFIFWWSPTINRADVYVGYETILEPTGVVMHGKLPTLKMSYLGIFKNNLWKKIQESLVYDFIKGIYKYGSHDKYDRSYDCIKLDTPTKKSYQFTIGYPDFIILINNLKFWVDIQLKWGDFDRMDPKKYAKVKYVEYTSHYLSKYPPDTNGGILIVFDLCYNLVDYYYEGGGDDEGDSKGGCGKEGGDGKDSKEGEDKDDGGKKDKLSLNHNNHNYYIDSILPPILQSLLNNNLSLHILRERIRSSLDIYSKEIKSVSSPKEIFHDSLIVEDRLLFTSNRSLLILDPESGTVFLKEVRPGEGKKHRVLMEFFR
ncbi:Pre-mRNA-splicing factor spp42 [Nosema bombycis CQ1]|uniref:Pre-mRNA-splicing factor spp42 n=1 Tax=Nosema bombycis (strain CQ1 / CVCC 102059) TaxID=578461 RepID=R0KL02_NOSB1|nr:Pre-mRNA-splicing factor spp42 [Nosema bombycis CQ1]|eukprot:EOB11301.1 Pre-mRNA-splicing factor spp42 [Nosema bombycis CQ1]